MNQRIEITHNGMVMHCYITGPITIQGVEEAYKERLSHPAFTQIKVLVQDCTEVGEVDYSTEEIKQDIAFAHKALQINPDFEIIGIMPSKLLHGLARMWLVYAESSPVKGHLVSSQSECDNIIEQLIN